MIPIYMILSLKYSVSCSSIIVALYLLSYKILIQNHVPDLFNINYSRDMSYDTVRTYVILIHSLP
jgi:hypothetical protein